MASIAAHDKPPIPLPTTTTSNEAFSGKAALFDEDIAKREPSLELVDAARVCAFVFDCPCAAVPVLASGETTNAWVTTHTVDVSVRSKP